MLREIKTRRFENFMLEARNLERKGAVLEAMTLFEKAETAAIQIEDWANVAEAACALGDAERVRKNWRMATSHYVDAMIALYACGENVYIRTLNETADRLRLPLGADANEGTWNLMVRAFEYRALEHLSEGEVEKSMGAVNRAVEIATEAFGPHCVEITLCLERMADRYQRKGFTSLATRLRKSAGENSVELMRTQTGKFTWVNA